MSVPTKHKYGIKKHYKSAILTISTSKYWAKDKGTEDIGDLSGESAQELVRENGHEVVYYDVLPDDEDLHHYKGITNKAKGYVKDSEKEMSIDITCPKCKRECIFKWQVFKNGSRHIRQKCLVHGYIRYTPQTEPYITLANQTSTK